MSCKIGCEHGGATSTQAVIVEGYQEWHDDVQVSVIIPTYRESENLPILIPRLAATLEGSGWQHEIIIVDDDSQDGTDSICSHLAEKYSVRLIKRSGERGLSSAVLRGMDEARGNILVVMDADLSHPPERVPALIDRIHCGEAEFAVGSRYVPGAHTDSRWGLARWLNSKVASLLARPLTRLRDPMSGFFALARTGYEDCARSLNPVGYKIGLELIVKGGYTRIEEVPIHFADRLYGKSKLSFHEQLQYLRHLRRLYAYRLGALAQPTDFVVVGLSGMVVDLSSFCVLFRLLPAEGARAAAVFAAMNWNFWLNRRLTFAGARRRPVMQQYLLFVTSCLLGACISWSLFVFLYEGISLLSRWPVLPAVVGILAGSMVNYVMSKYVTFR